MKIVFLGDSITDVGRNTNNGSLVSIGQGYPLLSAAKLSLEHPGRFEFLNSAVSGSRIVDVFARIKKDCWNHEPDLISILVGVNDTWHEFVGENGVDSRRFYRVYRMLIEDTLEKLPNAKLMLLEPFVLKASATESRWDAFQAEVRLRAEAVKRLAEEFDLLFVPLQEAFSEACAQQEASYWLGDGVHPTPAGHQLIANAWLAEFEKNFLTKN